jgi:hypothetical protein
MIALTLATEPPLSFSPPQIISVGALHRPLGGENANVSVDLDNGRGQLTSVFADPPLLCSAVLMRDGAVLLRGSLSAARIGSTVQLTVEA